LNGGVEIQFKDNNLEAMNTLLQKNPFALVENILDFNEETNLKTFVQENNLKEISEKVLSIERINTVTNNQCVSIDGIKNTGTQFIG
jgi:hypothetical protein